MARSTQIILIDDLDGGTGNETVNFGLDGVNYEIDLSKANAARLRKALAEFTDKGRRVSARSSSSARGTRSRSARTSRTSRTSPTRGSASGRDIPAIREWAKKKGLLASERGRIPAAVLEAYDASR